MRKITEERKKIFLKKQPFNFCDRFCERCEKFKDDCEIYREDVRFKMECLRKKKDPEDPEVTFEYIKNALREARKMLEEIKKEKKIKVTQKDIKKFSEESAREDKMLMEYPLYKKCLSFSNELHNFLMTFQVSLSMEASWLIPTLKKEFKEVSYYGPGIFVRCAGALQSKLSEDKWEKRDNSNYMVSGAISFYSLLAVEKSLESIREIMRGSQPIWALRINALLKGASETRAIFEDTFPGVEKFEKRIIFHGRY